MSRGCYLGSAGRARLLGCDGGVAVAPETECLVMAAGLLAEVAMAVAESHAAGAVRQWAALAALWAQ